MEEELVQRNKDLNDTINTANILKTFFDNAPVSMGLVELVENDKDVLQLFGNPTTALLLGIQPSASSGSPNITSRNSSRSNSTGDDSSSSFDNGSNRKSTSGDDTSRGNSTDYSNSNTNSNSPTLNHPHHLTGILLSQTSMNEHDIAMWVSHYRESQVTGKPISFEWIRQTNVIPGNSSEKMPNCFSCSVRYDKFLFPFIFLSALSW